MHMCVQLSVPASGSDYTVWALVALHVPADCVDMMTFAVWHLEAVSEFVLVQAASKALKEREAALLTLHAIEADLEKRRQAVTAIEGEGQKVVYR